MARSYPEMAAGSGDVKPYPVMKGDDIDQFREPIQVGANVWWLSGDRVVSGEVEGWMLRGVVVEEGKTGARLVFPAWRLAVVESHPPPKSKEPGKVSHIDLYHVRAGMSVDIQDGKRILTELRVTAVRPSVDEVIVWVPGEGDKTFPASAISKARSYEISGGYGGSIGRGSGGASSYPALDTYEWLDDPSLRKRAKARQQAEVDAISSQDVINDEVKRLRREEQTSEQPTKQARSSTRRSKRDDQESLARDGSW